MVRNYLQRLEMKRKLVYKAGVPPGHRSIRKARQNVGRTPHRVKGLPVARKHSISLPEDLSRWVVSQQQSGELFSHTMARLLNLIRDIL